MLPAVGKRGKRRNCQWKERVPNEWNNSTITPFIWRDHARGCLVDTAVACLCWLVHLYRLFHLGGISGKTLFLWKLHLTVLFAGAFRQFSAQLVWDKTGMVAGLAYFFSGPVSSLVA